MTLVIIALVVGALAGPTTLLHTFAVSVDILAQSIGWNSVTGVTISSRAGLAARAGRPFAARCINVIFFDQQHCEKAIAADLSRAQAAINILTKKGTDHA